MDSVRPPAVAGAFYPADPDVLRTTVDDLVGDAVVAALDISPRLVIVPHAGYVYSGSTAAAAYRLLQDLTDLPRRIVLVGPSHFVPFAGMAGSGDTAFRTPLGDVRLDDDLVARAALEPNPGAHAGEHSLEVQLPFLQRVLGEFSFLPLLTGRIEYQRAAEVLDGLLDDGVVGVISSDLSHYLDYETAVQRDERTAAAITALAPDDLGWDDACGVTGVQAALAVAASRSWACRLLDIRNSGDTAGDRARVVGYGAFAIGPRVRSEGP